MQLHPISYKLATIIILAIALCYPATKLEAQEAPPLLGTQDNTSTNKVSAADLDALKQKIANLEARLDAEIDPKEKNKDSSSSLFKLEVGGYGEIQFAYHDFGPDQTKTGGSLPDDRTVFDLTRFAIKIEGEMPYGFKFEAEIEFEHGGTGSALELEYEEFGEYDTEIEKGGEVVVEELYLSRSFSDEFSIKIGQFYVALGALSSYHHPTDYLGSTLPESETRVTPAVWSEIGISARYKHPQFKLTLQAVNGLDSTGFSSQRWIASGHQQRFETVRATDLAFVARVDITAIPNTEFGASAYFSPNTNGNRPKPDLKDVSAPLVLLSSHAIIDAAPIRVRASLVWGHLSNADVISDNNRRLSNNLDVLRSPIAEQALSFWAEVGFDLFHFSQNLNKLHRLELFVRFERYDTMFQTSGEIFDNPRFERTLTSAGLNYTFVNAVFAKLDWTHRELGTSDFRPENTARLSTGFIF